MSSRARPTSSLPKPPTSIAASAIISDAATLTGVHRIILGSDVVLHPRARLTSTHCPVTVRTGCIISEKANVGLQEPWTQEPMEGDVEGDAGFEIELGQNVKLDPGAQVEARRIGEGTLLEAGCKIGAGAVVGNFCRISPLCTVAPGEILPDFTIIYGNNQRRKEKPGLETPRRINHEKEIEVLRKLIPSNLAKWQST